MDRCKSKLFTARGTGTSEKDDRGMISDAVEWSCFVFKGGVNGHFSLTFVQ